MLEGVLRPLYFHSSSFLPCLSKATPGTENSPFPPPAQHAPLDASLLGKDLSQETSPGTTAEATSAPCCLLGKAEAKPLVHGKRPSRKRNGVTLLLCGHSSIPALQPTPREPRVSWGAGQLAGYTAAPQPKTELSWRFETFYLKETTRVLLLKTNLNLFLEATKSSVDIIFHFHHCLCGGWFQLKAEILLTYINIYIHLNTFSSREFQESSRQASE